MRALVASLLIAACGHSDEKKPPPPPPPPPEPTVNATAAFVDVTVVPMDSDTELAHQTVLVDGAKIVAIGPAASTGVPKTAQRIEGAGKWLMPGLVDMHVHFNDPSNGLLFVANGVTTVRNMWGNPQHVSWRERAAKNDPSWDGPAIYTAGPIVDGDPPIWPGSKVLKTAEEATAEVAAEKQAGYDFIKVYDGLPLAAYDALIAAAKQANIRVVGHVPAAVGLAHAMQSGQATIEHLTGYSMAAQDAKSKAATMPRGAEQRAEIAAHLDASKIPELAKATKDAGAANVPTLVVLARFAALDHPEVLLARPENKYVPPSMVASWDPKTDFRLKTMTPEAFAAMRDGNVFRAKLVKALVDLGAPVFAGTDTPNPFVVPGFALHEELGLLVAAGMTPYQALRAATAAPAAWLGAKDIGTIAVGSRADLVLLDADPRKDITATTKRAGVMVRGRWATQAELATKLDALAASFQVKDRFAGVPPLELKDADQLLSATFTTRFAGAEVGKERVLIGRTKAGHRIIVAQASSDPPQPKLAIVRVELDANDKLVAFELDEDGKHATATRDGAVLHITGSEGKSDEKLADDVLLDANLVSTMIPFADRAKQGQKVTVPGKLLAGTGKLGEASYTVERSGTKRPFVAHGPFGDIPGTYEADDKGFPIKVTAKIGNSEIVISRD